MVHINKHLENTLSKHAAIHINKIFRVVVTLKMF